eukprot:gb/GEZN01008086.1/.p1 GENE.gb/GEZN01008086.1/~~gb/GEZN01008086.1/.p1  ORF type:complete len:398 (-),score=61.74 gb/GEZN01008086.1/:274-1467(-)
MWSVSQWQKEGTPLPGGALGAPSVEASWASASAGSRPVHVQSVKRKSSRAPVDVADSREYKQFRASVPKKQIAVGQKVWQLFDFGPRNVPPLFMLPGTSGTADVFFQQILNLGYRGYRVIAAQYPDYWSVSEFVRGLRALLRVMEIEQCHLMGASLGGFLALHFAAACPESVLSLALCNSFADNSAFAQNQQCVAMFQWLPQFYLQKYILDSFPQTSLHPQSIDFAVLQLETLSRADLGARLTLNCTPSVVPNLDLDQAKITIIDTYDEVVLPDSVRQRLYSRFPKAKQALLKEGGDFPFLSNPSELAMHLQVHLRKQGLRPDLHLTQEELKAVDEQKADNLEEGSESDEPARSNFLRPQPATTTYTTASIEPTAQDERDLEEVLEAVVLTGDAAEL